jgi:hypothetical protein
LLALNKSLAAAGVAEIVLQAFTLVKGFAKEFGSMEGAQEAIEGLEKMKEGLK